MESLSYLLQGFETACSGWNLLYSLIGVCFGMFVGVLPGFEPDRRHGSSIAADLWHGSGFRGDHAGWNLLRRHVWPEPSPC